MATSQLSSRSSSVLRRRIVAAVLVVVSLALLTVYFRESSRGGLHSVQNAGSTVLRPFEVAATRVAQPFRDAASWIGGLNGAESESKKLRKENAQLRREVIQAQSAMRENQKLKLLLGYVSGPAFPQNYTAQPTSIVAQSDQQFVQHVLVAVGRGNGVQAYEDPVVTDEGLVGMVTKVAADVAQVTLITDPSSYVPAIDLRTGASGIVRHSDTGSGIIFDQVSTSKLVNPGDRLVTAGWRSAKISSIYPRGIPIATVASVGQSDIEPYKTIALKPLVDLSSLESVIVMMPKVRPR